MKKLLILVVLLSVFSIGLKAQNPIRVGGRQINVGAGISDWGIPVYAGIDFGIHQDFSVGVHASFSSFDETWDSTDYRRNVAGFNAVGNYHFNRILKISNRWDLYAGMNVGYYAWSQPADYYGSNETGTGLGIQIGGRYYFNEKLGLNLEMATGNSTTGIKFGISYLFK